jgi:L-ribulose-5-phosphate 3-epimerase
MGCFRADERLAELFCQLRTSDMTLTESTRREFLKSTAMAFAGCAVLNSATSLVVAAETKPLFNISLGEWAFHRALFSKSMKHFDVAKISKKECGIDALEYSAQFFMDKADDMEYLRELKKRATDNGVKAVLITVDSQGNIGDPDETKRLKAVKNHHKWVEAAKFLGCHAIRVNALSDEKLSADEQAKLVIDGLRRMVEFGAQRGVNVIVENHGGLSSNGKWMAKIMKGVDLPTTGTLPDFGNFPLQGPGAYDRYLGVAEMMPYAKGVSAKSYGFDAAGNETTIDYRRMVKIVVDAGYHSYLGIEYEGDKMSEIEGVRATKKLLETIRNELAHTARNGHHPAI